MSISELSMVFLIAFSGLAFFDGFVLHLWKYKLYYYDDTFYEHKLHTVRAVLFPIVLIGLFLFEIKGWLYVLVLTITVIDLIVQVFDMWEEKRARNRFGGLSSIEYILHVTLTSLHTSMLILYLIAKPSGSFTYNGLEIILAKNFQFLVVINLLPGAILVALLHLVLCHSYFRRGMTLSRK
ncbi:hypothetical protein [Leptospira bouyouniensis]|uniref:hypothetical protein n=1 Tax=Leptospira bouyouniensis TaxID=2484911 RepID=UPI001090F62F|nr:hypothetical protein [Leptospira bouyouniensis]TGM80216.1 hypothetical protein EHQ99_11000 [Leptospira bouyouniensis]